MRRILLKRSTLLVGSLVLALVVGLSILRPYLGLPRQVGADHLIGLTMQQVQERYGPPEVGDEQDPNGLWIYYVGWLGGGTGITFRDGKVDHVEVRDAR
ncbi:MAG TPA: hypothetical protein VHV55_02260 [Pirellulales bacterium]|jgi:hypothetical protein|nr:hypothetical protein [Pirellulales bacterium]